MLVSLLLLGVVCAEGHQNARLAGDRTITKVVKLLQKMMAESKKDAEKETELYAKYRCYVDKNTNEKEAAIKKATSDIAILENAIAGLQADNGQLSQEVAQLSTDMSENKANQKFATDIRTASKKSFDAMEEDLKTGIGQMKEALDVLTSIKLMQTQESVHKKEASLLSIDSKMQHSLTAASALLPADKRAMLESFLQAPLAADGATKGNAIVEILQKLQSTFEGNLKNAQDSEKAEKKAFDETIKTLEDANVRMDASKDSKEATMGKNDASMSTKKGEYETTVQQKKDDEEFLDKLTTAAATKAKNWEERKMLRANEDAAIAECISILNSDEAFGSFGKQDATLSGGTSASFLQMRQLRGGAVRQQVEALLEEAHSVRTAKIAIAVRKGNPFRSVLDEIKKMLKTITDEAQADLENKEWCEAERTNSNADLKAKKAEITSLNSEIDTLVGDIGKVTDDVKTGLKGTIFTSEESLASNQKAQTEATADRKKENAAYQVDVSDMSDAEDILGRALKVLANYYKGLEKHMSENTDSTNLLQADPSPPKTYDSFEGQSDQGNKALDMLKFIRDETVKEHAKADSDEADALSDYNGVMKGLKKDESDLQASIVKNKASLATKEKTLLEKQDDLKDTTKAKEAIEAYLLSIKPGCDFIKDNYTLREQNRATETTALNKAKTLIEGTPAYKEAEKKVVDQCADKCKLDKTNLDCKACMSGSTNKEYCSKHPGMPGCK